MHLDVVTVLVYHRPSTLIMKNMDVFLQGSHGTYPLLQMLIEESNMDEALDVQVLRTPKVTRKNSMTTYNCQWQK
jgi:hypothetical protein